VTAGVSPFAGIADTLPDSMLVLSNTTAAAIPVFILLIALLIRLHCLSSPAGYFARSPCSEAEVAVQRSFNKAAFGWPKGDRGTTRPSTCLAITAVFARSTNGLSLVLICGVSSVGMMRSGEATIQGR
jgi:hypothetical protein